MTRDEGDRAAPPRVLWVGVGLGLTALALFLAVAEVRHGDGW